MNDLNYLKLNAVNIYLMPTVQKSQSWEYLKRCEMPSRNLQRWTPAQVEFLPRALGLKVGPAPSWSPAAGVSVVGLEGVRSQDEQERAGHFDGGGGLTFPGKALMLWQMGECPEPAGRSSYLCGQKTPWTTGCRVGPPAMARSRRVSATGIGCQSVRGPCR